MARKKIIAGNWKMNMTPSQAVELINTLKPLVANDEVDVLSISSNQSLPCSAADSTIPRGMPLPPSLRENL